YMSYSSRVLSVCGKCAATVRNNLKSSLILNNHQEYNTYRCILIHEDYPRLGHWSAAKITIPTWCKKIYIDDGKDSPTTYYKITNDDRRKLLREIDKLLHSTPSGTVKELANIPTDSK